MNSAKWSRLLGTLAVLVALALPMLAHPAGATALPTLRPNAAGDTTTFTPFPNTGEANWQDVDDVTSDSDTTYVENTGTAKQELYNLTNSSIALGKINSVVVSVVNQRKWDTSEPNTFGLVRRGEKAL